jgi:hypothetical protein
MIWNFPNTAYRNLLATDAKTQTLWKARNHPKGEPPGTVIASRTTVGHNYRRGTPPRKTISILAEEYTALGKVMIIVGTKVATEPTSMVVRAHDEIPGIDLRFPWWLRRPIFSHERAGNDWLFVSALPARTI